mmetsp:Transcript_28538/g.71729  ORF Transcript_28538/g.71729 Transcript_28538/m.71729 type:complete len:177 (+) Transcript_28538:56-586(+)
MSIDREKTCPFLLRVFLKTGAHNPVESYSQTQVPDGELKIYTWFDATLAELTKLLQSASPEARRGRLSFSVVFLHPRGSYLMRPVMGQSGGGPGDRTLKELGVEAGDYMDVAVLSTHDRRGGGASDGLYSASSRHENSSRSRAGGAGGAGGTGGFLGGHGRFGRNRRSGGGGGGRR